MKRQYVEATVTLLNGEIVSDKLISLSRNKATFEIKGSVCFKDISAVRYLKPHNGTMGFSRGRMEYPHWREKLRKWDFYPRKHETQDQTSLIDIEEVWDASSFAACVNRSKLPFQGPKSGRKAKDKNKRCLITYAPGVQVWDSPIEQRHCGWEFEESGFVPNEAIQSLYFYDNATKRQYVFENSTQNKGNITSPQKNAPGEGKLFQLAKLNISHGPFEREHVDRPVYIGQDFVTFERLGRIAMRDILYALPLRKYHPKRPASRNRSFQELATWPTETRRAPAPKPVAKDTPAPTPPGTVIIRRKAQAENER